MLNSSSTVPCIFHSVSMDWMRRRALIDTVTCEYSPSRGITFWDLISMLQVQWHRCSSSSRHYHVNVSTLLFQIISTRPTWIFCRFVTVTMCSSHTCFRLGFVLITAGLSYSAAIIRTGQVTVDCYISELYTTHV